MSKADAMDNGTLKWSTHVISTINGAASSPLTAIGQIWNHGYYEAAVDLAGVASEQFIKLGYMMNCFEQIMMPSVTFSYVPRITMVSVADTAAATAGISNGLGWIGLVEDHEDSNVRATLQEYQQVRMQKEASFCPITQSISQTVTPHYNSATESQFDSGALGTYNDLPKPATWMSTKVQNVQSGTVFLNMYTTGTGVQNQITQYQGIKIYTYLPFPATTASVIGLITITSRYEFRFPDYRAILGTPTLIEDDQTRLERLQRIQENRLMDIAQVVIMTPKKELWKKTTEGLQDTPMLDKIKRKNEAIEDLIGSSSQNIRRKVY